MKPRIPGTMVALLSSGLKVALQVRWAVRLAAARQMDLLILERVESRDDRMLEIPLDKPPGRDATGVTRELIRVIEKNPNLRAGPRDGAGTHVIHLRLKQAFFTSLQSLRRLVLVELSKNKVGLLTAAHEQSLGMVDTELVKERRLLLRYIPCEVVLC